MTTWAISVADTFFNELLNLPQAIQKKVSKVVKTLEADPISAQGDAKKLKGYTNNVYRVRLGDYRLFYSFGQGWVKLLSIRKRDERHLIQKWQPEQDMIRKSVSHDDYKRYCGLIHYQSFTGVAQR